MKKHYNIPIFVPHYGCPFSCVFCNQNEITGRESETDIFEAERIIEEHLSNIKGDDIEIAFFGGSFTAIPKNIMLSYLDLAEKYIKSGRVRGIRLSTRPDFIDREILDMLASRSVTTIELGVQSFSDEVLLKSGRGHKQEASRRACELINEYGSFSLGIQLMCGLPGDTKERSLNSALIASSYSPKQVRIYPTLVIKDTYLEKMFERGEYCPQTLEEAVETVGEMLDIFDKNGIPVIRVGLSSIDEMNSNGAIIAGPSHPALRELCEGKKYLIKLENFITSNKKLSDTLVVSAPKSEFSKISGHKRINGKTIYEKYKIKLIFKESDVFSLSFE